MSTETADGPGSTKPYLLRALYEWCCDNGFTPYLAVQVDSTVRVPREHVRNGEIVLNISFGATSGLNMGNDDVSFRARFGGVARDIVVPVSHITAIYARENGQGMAFPAPQRSAQGQPENDAGSPSPAGKPSPVSTIAAPPTPAAPNAPATPPVVRGAPPPPPRLHSVPAAPSETAPPASGQGDDEPDPPPRTPGPHLKRVK